MPRTQAYSYYPYKVRSRRYHAIQSPDIESECCDRLALLGMDLHGRPFLYRGYIFLFILKF